MLIRILLVYCISWGAVFRATAAEKSDESSVKAAFLFQFTRFIDWPAGADSSKDFSICVLEQPQVAKSLEVVTESKSVHGKKISVNALTGGDSFEKCSILYIGMTEHEKVKQVLSRVAALRNHAILTVSHARGLAQDGVMINFFLEDDHLRFEVNINAAKNANLALSSQILKLARIIE